MPLLLTTHFGTPMLLFKSGLTIEPEPQAQDRVPGSIIIMPNNNREKPKMIVQQPFVDICKALAKAGQLVEVAPEPEPVVKVHIVADESRPSNEVVELPKSIVEDETQKTAPKRRGKK